MKLAIRTGNITGAILASAFASIASAADAIPVTVEPLGNLLVNRELRAPAVVISANRADLTSQVAALIENFLLATNHNGQSGIDRAGFTSAHRSI